MEDKKIAFIIDEEGTAQFPINTKIYSLGSNEYIVIMENGVVAKFSYTVLNPIDTQQEEEKNGDS